MDEIFLSYRRDDSAARVQWIKVLLDQRTGPEAVFLDTVSIPPGTEWADRLRRTLRSAQAVLVIIGPNWLGARDEWFRRRIDDEDDWVRKEIEQALDLSVHVVPVLVDGATMPPPESLPKSLARLAGLQAIEIRDETDIDELLRSLNVRVSPASFELTESSSDPESVAPPDLDSDTGKSTDPARPRAFDIGQVPRIPPRCREFVGRDEYLAMLDETLTSAGAAVLYGLGGAGKSAIAVEYLYRRSDHYDLVWWISGASPGLIAGRLAELAHVVGLGEAADPAATVAKLLEQNDRWLLVFDDCDDPTAIQPLLNKRGGGHVLITSTNAEWSAVVASVRVDAFKPEESTALFQLVLPEVSPGDAHRVGEALGYLPLAVTQAAAFIDLAQITVDRYLDELSDHEYEMLSAVAPVAAPVINVHQLTFSRLNDENPSALQLLELLSWLAPAPVPRFLLSDYPHRLPDPLRYAVGNLSTFTAALAAIRRHSAAEINSDSVVLPRVSGMILRHTSGGDLPEQDGWPCVVVRLLDVAVPLEEPGSPGSWPLWAALLPHVLTVCDSRRDLRKVSREVSWLLERAADYLHFRGSAPIALRLRERVHGLDLVEFGPDHPITLNSTAGIAVELSAVGDYDSAERLNREALDGQQRTLGKDDSLTLGTANNLAIDLRRLGRIREARQLNEDTLARKRRVFGYDHPTTLLTANNLANDLRAAGQYADSRRLTEETLTREVLVLGDEHRNTLATATNLTIDLRSLGETDQARYQDEDTYARKRRLLGDDHPSTLITANNLANDYRLTGEHQKARQLTEETFERQRRVLGEDHPNTLITASNLAIDLLMAGDSVRAIELHDDIAHRLRADTVGVRHSLIPAVNHFARDLVEPDRPEDMAHAEKALMAQMRRSLGVEDPSTLSLVEDLYRVGGQTRPPLV